MPSNARTAGKMSVILLQRHVCDEMHGLIGGIPSLLSVARQTRLPRLRSRRIHRILSSLADGLNWRAGHKQKQPIDHLACACRIRRACTLVTATGTKRIYSACSDRDNSEQQRVCGTDVPSDLFALSVDISPHDAGLKRSV
jgi:hypothetical protein